jgi:hypothetical protein
MSPEEQFGKILALLGENSKGISELKQTMFEIRLAKEEIEAWRPEVDTRVTDLEKAVNHLGERVEKLLTDPVKSTSPTGKLPTPSLAPSRHHRLAEQVWCRVPPIWNLPCSGAMPRPKGHREELHHRSAGFGRVYTFLDPPPITGTMNITKSSSDFILGGGSVPSDWQACALLSVAMLDLPFPKFGGTNPKLWIRNCETFFEVYLVHPRLWIRYSTMHLTGSAALWFQTV